MLIFLSKLFLNIGLHPTAIAEAFEKAADKATEILKSISIPIKLSDKESLHQSASTALNSKVKIKAKTKDYKMYLLISRLSLNILIFLLQLLLQPYSKSLIQPLILMLIYVIFVSLKNLGKI
jgi:hypothetical protein